MIAIMQLAILHSVLYKTEVDPASSIYKHLLNDTETADVIMSMYTNKIRDHEYEGILDSLFANGKTLSIKELKSRL